MRPRSLLLNAARLAVLGLLLAGCGKNNLGQVTGTVTVGGKPITGGTIMFYPFGGPGAVGEIKPDGTYTLTTFRPGDGAAIGQHKVAIHATRIGPSSIMEAKSIEDELRTPGQTAGGKMLVPGKVTWLVPEKYSLPEQSPLTAEVKAGQNTIDFTIPAE